MLHRHHYHYASSSKEIIKSQTEESRTLSNRGLQINRLTRRSGVSCGLINCSTVTEANRHDYYTGYNCTPTLLLLSGSFVPSSSRFWRPWRVQWQALSRIVWKQMCNYLVPREVTYSNYETCKCIYKRSKEKRNVILQGLLEYDCRLAAIGQWWTLHPSKAGVLQRKERL